MKSKLPPVVLLLLLSSLYSQEVLIVYYSARGHTAAMAQAVADGARSAPRASRVRNHLLIRREKAMFIPNSSPKVKHWEEGWLSWRGDCGAGTRRISPYFPLGPS